MWKKFNITIGGGDSRNPDEIASGKPCMHTNSIVTWIKHNNTWYSSYIHGVLKLSSYFESCQSEADCDYVFENLKKEGYIWK